MPTDDGRLTCGSLFSGVGGMDIGLTWAGFDHIFFAEQDEWCRQVIATRWPGSYIYEDVRDVATDDDDHLRPWLSRNWSRVVEGSAVHGDADSSGRDKVRGGQDRHGGTSERGTSERRPDKQSDLRHAERSRPHAPSAEQPEPGRQHITTRLDLLCGGFPCQDISQAGKRAGLAGERSGLWWEFHRAINALRPRAVLIENVEGLLSSGDEKGADLAAIIEAMADSGYSLSWRLLDSQHLGVPQRRRRLFLLAIADDDPAARRIGEVLALSPSSIGDPPSREPSWPGLAGSPGSSIEGDRGERAIGVNVGNPDVAGTIPSNQQGGQRTTHIAGAYVYRKSRRAQSTEDAETWVDDGLANTLNQYDVGDVRTTHAVVQPTAYNVRPEYGNGADLRVDEAEIDPTLAQQTHLPGYDRGIRVVSPTLTHYNLDSRSPQSEEQQRIVRAVHEVTSTVRRLTPMECERLMFFPDGWTDIPWRKKDTSPDSRRYAACGNAVVSSVSYWIGWRLAQVLNG